MPKACEEGRHEAATERRDFERVLRGYECVRCKFGWPVNANGEPIRP